MRVKSLLAFILTQVIVAKVNLFRVMSINFAFLILALMVNGCLSTVKVNNQINYFQDGKTVTKDSLEFQLSANATPSFSSTRTSPPLLLKYFMFNGIDVYPDILEDYKMQQSSFNSDKMTLQLMGGIRYGVSENNDLGFNVFIGEGFGFSLYHKYHLIHSDKFDLSIFPYVNYSIGESIDDITSSYEYSKLNSKLYSLGIDFPMSHTIMENFDFIYGIKFLSQLIEVNSDIKDWDYNSHITQPGASKPDIRYFHLEDKNNIFIVAPGITAGIKWKFFTIESSFLYMFDRIKIFGGICVHY